MQKTLVALTLLLSSALVASCDLEEGFPSVIPCTSSRDCPSNAACIQDVCALSDGTTGRDTGTRDTGTHDTGTTPPDTSQDTGVVPIDTGGTGPTDTGGNTDTICTPSCAGAQCGSDGCGGSCGTCGGGSTCVGRVCQMSSTDNCQAIISCVNTNECDTQDCLSMCLEHGTAPAQDQFLDLLECIEVSCADTITDEEFAECQYMDCGDELGACVGAGTDDCMTTLICILQCADSDCYQGCLSNGTTQAQYTSDNLYACGFDNCAEAVTIGDFLDCAEATCPSEFAACEAN